jgi:uncharacterized PurR-regulated membrane protein YhhQ (DUF165 family)
MKNLKVKALALMAGWMGAVLAGVAVVQLLARQFGSEVVMNMVVSGFVVWLLYMVYTLILARLEYDAKVDALSEKNTNKQS